MLLEQGWQGLYFKLVISSCRSFFFTNHVSPYSTWASSHFNCDWYLLSDLSPIFWCIVLWSVFLLATWLSWCQSRWLGWRGYPWLCYRCCYRNWHKRWDQVDWVERWVRTGVWSWLLSLHVSVQMMPMWIRRLPDVRVAILGGFYLMNTTEVTLYKISKY